MSYIVKFDLDKIGERYLINTNEDAVDVCMTQNRDLAISNPFKTEELAQKYVDSINKNFGNMITDVMVIKL